MRHGGRDVLEVRGLSADDAPDADDRVEPAGFRGASRRLRQLEGPGYCEELDVGLGRASLTQRGGGAGRQPARQRLVEPGDDDGEARAVGVTERHRGVWLAHGLTPP
jgi:hypothetical protein